ncbi:MAG TPA: hypothetical protein VNF04_02245 [Stellaceae bacterium]|nr:hypothetical protein [Stellaceae bacterium]
MRLHLALASLSCLLAISGTALAQGAPSDPPSAIHGFNDVTLKSDYITPRGLLVTNKELTTQILNGLVLDAYHNPATPIDDISLVAGIWNDLDAAQNDPKVGPWNEFDWFVGANFEVNKIWTLGVTYEPFLNPATTGFPATEHNVEFSLKLDDSSLLAPIALHPYAKLFYNFAGPSPVVFGIGHTFDVELGVVPTLDLHPYNVAANLTAPTWITVGPSDFWGGGGNAGVVSTGLTATFPLDFVPKQYGNWNFHIGFQYYHLINHNLVLAQTITGAAGGGSGHRDIVTGFGGIGMNF